MNNNPTEGGDVHNADNHELVQLFNEVVFVQQPW
jgi:hypothetical protein